MLTNFLLLFKYFFAYLKHVMLIINFVTTTLAVKDYNYSRIKNLIRKTNYIKYMY